MKQITIYKNIQDNVLPCYLEDKVNTISNLIYNNPKLIYNVDTINDFTYGLSKHTIVKTEKDCSGYFDYYNKEIGLNFESFNSDIFNGYLTIFHEIGHYYINNEYNTYYFSFLESLEEEQHVELFSHNIVKNIFKILYNKNISNKYLKYLTSYYNYDDILFLSEWYEIDIPDNIDHFYKDIYRNKLIINS